MHCLRVLPFILTVLSFTISAYSGNGDWQQDVHYTIKATLNPITHTITGSETLFYTNNSPDTLREVYFRLYWNLFQKGSHGHKLAGKRKRYDFDVSGGVTVKKFALFTEGKEEKLSYRIDDTILHAELPRPLRPGEKLEFAIDWTENIPLGGDRAGRIGRDYNIAQWYPQIAVFDRYGWHTDQYTGTGEFHIDYGIFDVEITLPRSFIVAHTGVLLNPREVLPDSVIRKLEDARGKQVTTRIADFSERTIHAEDTSNVVTWKFRAENVRDFAWTANEYYIWDLSYWEDVAIHALYFSDKAEFWKEVATYGRHCLQLFSDRFGRYVYRNVFIVEGVVGGGMEYPGVMFIGHLGSKHSHTLFGVVAHELGHQWYPMMVGSNETEYAFQDEGFATFLTTLALEDYYGRYDNHFSWTTGIQKFLRFPNTDDRSESMKSYLLLAKTGYEEPIATHSDQFEEPGLSGISVYPKTATVMFMLQYVLGDSVFNELMIEYYNRWKFRNAYPEDFFSLAQEVSGSRDLRWFFEQWFYRTYQCDFSLRRISSKKRVKDGKEIYATTVTIKRYGQAIMPIDVLLRLEDGSRSTLYIPVEVWKNGVSEHKVEVDLPSKPERGEINPDKRIADVNRLNNTYPWPKVRVEFENTVFSVQDPFAYIIRWRPSLWFNDVDGVKLGVKLSGQYLDDLHNFNAWTWMGTRNTKFNFDLSAWSSLPRITPLAYVSWRGFRIEGRQGLNVSFSKQFRKHYSYPPYQSFSIGFSHMKLQEERYLLRPNTWERGLLNRVLFNYNYENRGEFWQTQTRFEFESSVSLRARSQFNYSKRTFDIRLYLRLPEDMRFAVRLYNGRASGTIPVQTQYFLAGASPIEEFSNPFFRSKGILPTTVREHALYPGGGNLRGFYNQFQFGDKIDAANVELRFPNLIPFMKSASHSTVDRIFSLIRLAAFMDVGRIAFQNEDFSKERLFVDAGFGFRVRMPSSTTLFRSIGLTTLRVDFPIYVSRAAPGEARGKFRWVVGLNETF